MPTVWPTFVKTMKPCQMCFFSTLYHRHFLSLSQLDCVVWLWKLFSLWQVKKTVQISVNCTMAEYQQTAGLQKIKDEMDEDDSCCSYM